MSAAFPSGWANLGPLPTAFVAPSECNTFTISYATPIAATATLNDTGAFTTPYVSPRLIWYDPVTAPSCFPTPYPVSDLHGAAVTTDIKLPTITTRSTIYPATTAGYFYPGRCPQGWTTRLLEYDFIPTGHTLAECCPTLPTSAPLPLRPRDILVEKELEKRRGSNGKHTPRHIVGCSMALPSVTYSRESSPTLTSYRPPQLATITAVANGTLTTVTPSAWKSIADEGMAVIATAVIVMWQRGDFPDIDSSASVASASASDALDKYQQKGKYAYGTFPSTSAKVGIGCGVAVGVFFIALIAFLFKRRAMHKRGDSMTGAFFKRAKSHFLTKEVLRKSEDGLLAGEAKDNPTFVVIPKPGSGRDDIESAPVQNFAQETKATPLEENPPAYAPAGESSTATTDTRAWNETNLEYEARRLKERKQLLTDRIRLGREEDELRAKMKARGP